MIRREGAKNTMRGARPEKRDNPRGSAWGLVVLADFKSVGVAAQPGWVGSIPTRFRHSIPLQRPFGRSRGVVPRLPRDGPEAAARPISSQLGAAPGLWGIEFWQFDPFRRHSPGPLRDPRPDRRGWDGGGVPGTGYEVVKAGNITAGELKVNPNFDPLRKNPRFQKLVAGGE